MLGKIISLIIALGYLVVVMVKVGGLESFLSWLLLVILPLALIWFSDEMGNYTGPTGGAGLRPDYSSPGCLVRFFGWLLLLAPIFYVFYSVVIKHQPF